MQTNIQCPNCSTTINVDELITTQLETTIKAQMEVDLQRREDLLKERMQHLDATVEQIARDKLALDKTVNERSKNLLAEKEKALRADIFKEIEKEKEVELTLLSEELTRKSSQLKELNATKAQNEKLLRDLDELESLITLKMERELSEKLIGETTKIRERVDQEAQFKLKEKEKVIQDLSAKLDEAKRKADQGSVQLIGEVQELELVRTLQEIHPFDIITQSKKGANAADVLQLVRTGVDNNCGKIYYESKRTKTWSNEWITKFKKDNLNTNADILVLVTNTLPKDVSKFALVDGIWVCSFSEVKELSVVLRFGLLKIYATTVTQQGRETKMEMLYNYLTSIEFKNVFGNILDNYQALLVNHHSEKLKLQRIWKEREKVLEEVLSSTVDFYGAIKGIAGQAIPAIEILEMPERSAEDFPPASAN